MKHKNPIGITVLYKFLWSIILSAAIIATGAPALAGTPPRNIIIISWDGVQRNHLAELMKDAKLPNLALLAGEGRLFEMDVTGHKTDTKAGHTQMLTGYEPATTGVYNNKKYGPIPAGHSVFERLEKYFGPDNIVTIALTGKAAHIGSRPAGMRREGKGKGKKKRKIQAPAEPWNIVKHSLDLWDGDKQRDAAEVGPKALEYLNKYKHKPFFFFLHFSDPDHAGHRHGENSREYSDAIVTCDAWLGKLRAELDALGIAANTTIYVTTDHGFDEGLPSHSNAPYIWFATNDPDAKNAPTTQGLKQMDVSPTILKHENVPLDTLEPPLPGKPIY